jgi:uncharacterized protein (DUF1778 family)
MDFVRHLAYKIFMANPARKTTGKIDEARISIRAKADLRDTISYAADLSGLDLSNFIKSVALERANEIIREHETMRITSAEDRAAFRAALLEPGRHNPALAELLAIPPVLNATKR